MDGREHECQCEDGAIITDWGETLNLTSKEYNSHVCSKSSAMKVLSHLPCICCVSTWGFMALPSYFACLETQTKFITFAFEN